MSIWNAGLEKPFIEFLRDPANLVAIQETYECYSKDAKILQAVESRMLSDAGFRSLYEEWFEPTPYSIDELLSLPKESFGFAYGNFLQSNNLSLNFITEFPGKNVLAYMWNRNKHVHDIVHAILGFGRSLTDEIAVKGFEIAQYQSPATLALLSAGMIAESIQNPADVLKNFEALMTGFKLSEGFPLLMGIRWDLEWKTPVEELKVKYNLPFFGGRERGAESSSQLTKDSEQILNPIAFEFLPHREFDLN